MTTTVDSTRFQTLMVKKAMPIREFVKVNKLEFAKGKGYYQLTKPENIQIYKNVVVRRKSDNSYIAGPAVKEILGLDVERRHYIIDRSKLPDFDIFVQSTSYNRNLVAKSEFLYETTTDDFPTARKRPARSASPSTSRSPLTPIPAPPCGGPGGPIEIVFSFDTTGSMSSCLDEVRTKLKDMIQRLTADIPGLRIAVIAHGDYCDAREYYVTKYVDFTNDIGQLCEFVNNVSATGGGDFEECYELVLNEVREKLSWTPGTQRALVMIGDATPHEPNYHLNKRKLNWKKEVDALLSELGVRIYAVQCLNNSSADLFYQTMATKTNGNHLRLDEFSNVFDFLMAICYREQGVEYFEAYEKEVRMRPSGSGMNAELHRMFEELRRADDVPSEAASSSTAVSSTSDATSKDDDEDDGPSTSDAASTVKKAKIVATKPKAKKFHGKAPDTPKVATKTAKKQKKDTKKTAENKRLPREQVPHTKFVLNTLKWTPWFKALASSKDAFENCSSFGPKFAGYANADLFVNSTNKVLPTMYEFAVQPKTGSKKYVVYHRITKGLPQGSSWSTYLLRNVIDLVNMVIKNNCTLFVRRAVLPKVLKTSEGKIIKLNYKGRDIPENYRSVVRAKYSYAWDRRLVKSARKVVKCEKVVSC